MKNLSIPLYLIAAMLFALPSHAQWANLNANIQGDLYDVHFITETEGHVVGEDGIFLTTNGGNSWSMVVINNNPTESLILGNTVFKSVFHNGYTWFAAGEDQQTGNGVIFVKTTTAPIRWKLAYENENSLALHDLSFASNWSVAVGESGLAVRSYDPYGLVWNVVNTGISGDINTVTFDNFFHTFFNSTAGLFYEATGDVWNKILDKNFVDIRGYASTILTCITQDSSASVSSSSIYWYYTSGRSFPAGFQGTCLGINDNANIIGTTNGMLKANGNWEIQPSSIGYHINGLHFPNYNIGYAVSNNGAILKTMNAGGTTIPIAGIAGPDGGCTNSPFTFYSTSSYDYVNTWQLDNEPPVVGGQSFITPIFTSPGQHSLQLTVSNGVDSDTETLVFHVTEPPSVDVSYTLPDVPICKSGSASVQVHNSDPNNVYRLQNINGLAPNTAFFPGNGNDISINTGIINETAIYYLEVKSAWSDCQAYIYDTITIEVEQTKAGFQASLINVHPGEPVLFSNNSHNATSQQWQFGQGAAISNATTPTVTNSFSNTGPASAQLIATSAFGCADTLTLQQPFVYDPNISPSDCWSLTIGGEREPNLPYEHDDGEGIALDGQGNIYISGDYHDAVLGSKFGAPSPMNEGSGFYVAKYTSEGILKWVVKSLELEDHDTQNESHIGNAYDVEVTEDGHVLLTGWTEHGAVFYGTDGDTVQIVQHDQFWVGGFVLKISPTGVILWHGLLNSIGNHIGSDEVGNVYVSGAFSSDLAYISPSGVRVKPYNGWSFYPGRGVVKLSPSGEYLWYVTLDFKSSNSSYIGLNGFEVARNGDVFLCGSFSYEGVTFNSVNTAAKTLAIEDGWTDIFVAKYNTDGNLQWANPITSKRAMPTGGSSIDYGNSIAADAAGNVYFSMKCASYSSGDQVIFTSSENGKDSVQLGNYVLASYDGDGNFRWAAGGRYDYEGLMDEITISPCGSVFVSGSIGIPSIPLSTFDHVSADGSINTFTTIGFHYVIAKYTSTGIIQWLKPLGEAINADPLHIYGFSKQMVADASDNLFVVGNIWSNNFTNSYAIANDTMMPIEEDAFLAKFNPSFCGQEQFGNIQTDFPSGNYCPGDTVVVGFEAIGLPPIGTGNQWQLLLSDENGCIGQNPLQSIPSGASSGSFQFVVPFDLPEGQYFLQISTTQPAFTGTPFAIGIHPVPTPKHLDFAICPGTSVSLLANDGTAWQWSPSVGLSATDTRQAVATPLVPTVYLVEVASFCGPVTDTFDLTLLDPVVTGLPQDTFLCGGDSILLEPNAGNIYAWSPFSQNLTALGNGAAWVYPIFDQIYQISATDPATGCHTEDSIAVTAFWPNYNATFGSGIVCQGVPLDFQIFTSTQPMQVEWEVAPFIQPMGNSAIVTPTESTFVTYTMNWPPYGCTVTDSSYFQVIPVVEPEIFLDPPFIFTFADYNSYVWYLNGELIPGQDDFNYVSADTGYYQVQVVDINGCTLLSDSFLIMPLSSRDAYGGNISIFPNPFTTEIRIVNNGGLFQGEIRLENVVGVLVQLEREIQIPANGSHLLGVNTIPPGVYYLNFISENGSQKWRVKLIKQ